ncbi:MAG: DUF4292 domain-containing protein [Cyclobacteriaceae bacterium]
MNKSLLAILVLGIVTIGCNKKFSGIFHRDHSIIKVNEIGFDYFSGKMKLDFEGEKNLSGVANLRIRKDSVIWISLSPGLGVEVARILIAKDSVAIIDKFNKKYITSDFDKLSAKFGFDINYHLVESLMLGNLITPYSSEELVKSENAYEYEQWLGNFHLDNYIGAKTMKLERLQVQDTASNSSISVRYTDFQLVESQVLPFEIIAKLFKEGSKDASTRLDIEYSKAEIEKKPLKFPFNVPQKYERDEAD